ncbi:MAG: biosynthetic-type acetolactate synthase large subunit [Agathobacter sp.]|uniref:biosynthetic-type acetolactate synthase large subunit n=1 Tax=Agathobacter sp. TaxID=2021311 RepID=UPI00258FF67F|nr:biosynthetic-type acetolactate synthase large subunit [Agathobacter sp.]MCR5676576.1 biosynthetic-type acetolactate synthase large subunit [Agathobacter sp.]
MDITGRKLFVKALQEEGVDTIFAYPGGTVTDLFDELYKTDAIDLVLPRHEQGLIHEAEGYAKSTGKVGVCLVTSGPGATNIVTGLADAHYDNVPLVCFTGQVPRALIGNDAFQEVDIVGITRSITKYSVTVHDRAQLGKIIKMAFHIARTGKPGPVLIDLPKDIQTASGSADYPEKVEIRGYKINEGVHVGQLKKAYKLLKSAKKPLILAGGGIHIAGAYEELKTFAEKIHVPVVTTVMGKGAIASNHELYIGNCGMHGRYSANKAVSECDVLFSIGTRFNDRITGDLNEFAPKAKIVHIDIDTASISRNVVVDIPIVADAKIALDKLNEWAEAKNTSAWQKQIEEWEQENPLEMRRDKGLSPQMIMEEINRQYPTGIYVTDVGQHQMWASQYLQLTQPRQFLTSGGLGTMGFGLPAAIGAKIANRDREVVCISGDGGLQMNIQELATAVVQSADVTVCVLNNYYLGMVRQMQQLFYGKRYSATCLRRRLSCPPDCKGPNDKCPKYVPDFVKLVESYGGFGIRVETAEELEAAFAEAKKHKGVPRLIECMISTDELVLPMVKGGNPMSEMILK